MANPHLLRPISCAQSLEKPKRVIGAGCNAHGCMRRWQFEVMHCLATRTDDQHLTPRDHPPYSAVEVGRVAAPTRARP
jgi:hypothetical protein